MATFRNYPGGRGGGYRMRLGGWVTPAVRNIIIACTAVFLAQTALTLFSRGAATALLREYLPALKVRVVNVVDLMTLQPREEHPHGLSDFDYDTLFTTDKPIVFAYHGYPWLIHRLTYRRTSHAHLHVRGYKEEGTTTTPFDMVVRNDLDRFHLVIDVINRVPKLGYRAAYLKQLMRDKLIEHRQYINRYGEDMPEIREWKWPQGATFRSV